MGITTEPKTDILCEAPKSENQSKEESDKLCFSENVCMSCVGIIDIVNSTKITAQMSRNQMRRFYSHFLNWATAIVTAYGGLVVKNMGDSLLFHFPVPEDQLDKRSIRDCLNCSIALSKLQPNICSKFRAESLPDLNYRISVDFGEVSFATSADAPNPDIFSITVNICSKINSFAAPNMVVIGGDMYEVSKDLSGYSFQETSRTVSVSNRSYPVYTVTESKSGFRVLQFIRNRASPANSQLPKLRGVNEA